MSWESSRRKNRDPRFEDSRAKQLGGPAGIGAAFQECMEVYK
jgi:hypothetical protein